MELRQLHYFVTLSEELHFARAAAREHIVPSALSQQIQRLERGLGVPLVQRDTHHVRLTKQGEAFLSVVRDVLRQLDLAVMSAQSAASCVEEVRVAVGDPSFNSMPLVLRHLQNTHSNLAIHRIEAPLPEQFRMLASGRLAVGIGLASHAPPGIESELFRLDPFGVLLAPDHRLAGRTAVAVPRLAGERILLPDQEIAPEFNAFVTDLCKSAGFALRRFHGSVQSVRAAAELVSQHDCIALVPSSCDLLPTTVHWLPLTDPPVWYPWSLVWRAGAEARQVMAVVESARSVRRRLGWVQASAGDSRDLQTTGSTQSGTVLT